MRSLKQCAGQIAQFGSLRRLSGSAEMKQVKINFNKQRSLVDEPLHISISGLEDSAKVTLHLRICESYGNFSAFGHFFADPWGCVDLSNSASYDGTYTGVDAMGLFWSLNQEPGQKLGLRLLRREAAKPLVYKLRCVQDHVTWDQLMEQPDQEELCSVQLERSYLSDTVERLPIRSGRVRGCLFVPKHRRCPVVVDIFGTGGGLMEHRAALLAKEGFCVLALAYFGYDDLPKELTEIDLDYFVEAVEVALASDRAVGDCVGLIGVSLGADLVAQLAIVLRQRAAAAVWINGTFCHQGYPISYRGQMLPNYIPWDVANVRMSHKPPGLDLRQFACNGCTVNEETQVELATCQFLFLSSLDDYSTAPESGQRLVNRLRRAGQSNFEHVIYPDAGHLLEPPVTPCTALCYHGLFRKHMLYGGEAKMHHLAQVDSWRRTIDLMRRCLPQLPKL